MVVVETKQAQSAKINIKHSVDSERDRRRRANFELRENKLHGFSTVPRNPILKTTELQ